MRSRNLKPGFFKNELLGTADPFLMLLYGGLWCFADRKGCLENRPLKIKAEIFPYRDKLDINRYLTELSRLGFIQYYKVDSNEYIYLPKFTEHQRPHHTERDSNIPMIPIGSVVTGNSPLDDGGNPPDSLVLIPDSLVLNKTITSELKKNSTLKVIPWPDEEKDFETFIKTQKYIPPILDYGWWDAVSVAINGISIPFVESEFAKMSAWIKENPRRGPTQKGVKRFVRVWLEKSAEERRRKSAKG